MLPQRIHTRALAAILNRDLARGQEEGEMDFLQGRSVTIEIRDVGLCYRLTLHNGSLKESCVQGKSDLEIRASLYDLMSLVSRQEDPDTLVFQRRLVMEGDTEPGLAFKNYLDGLDIELSSFPLWVNDELKPSLRQSGYSVQLGLTGYEGAINAVTYD